MKVLVVKTSSMGDLIHTLPAITDASKAHPKIQFDWVAESAFAEIPGWHPNVNTIIPIAIRRWRKTLRKCWQQGEIQAAYNQLRSKHYDVIIDAQGLVKSALVARCAQGQRFGMDWRSSREPLASWFYQHKITVPKGVHAIARVRQLFAQVLDYQFDNEVLDYGLNQSSNLASEVLASSESPFLIFLHGTSRLTKYWRQDQWLALAKLAQQAGYEVYLPWGNQYERDYAELIAGQSDHVKVLAKMSLSEIAALMTQAQGVVGVDTGLAHLAAALNIPAVTLYIETLPSLTGACGQNQTCLSEQRSSSDEPIIGLDTLYYEQITADNVWETLVSKL